MAQEIIPFEETPEDAVITGPDGNVVAPTVMTEPPDFIPFDQEDAAQRILYVSDKDAAYSYPKDTNDDELEEAVQTEVYGKPKSDFLYGVAMKAVLETGKKELGLLSAFSRGGAAAFGVSVPTRLAASHLRSMAETEDEYVPTLEETAQIVGGRYDILTKKMLTAGFNRFKPVEPQTALDRAMIDQAFKILEKGNEILSNEFFQAPEEGTAEKVAFDLGGASASLMAAVGITWLTKNPMAAVALFGDIAGSEAYLRARAEGKTPAEARRIGWQAFAVEGGLEYIGLDYFTKAMRGSKTLARVALKMGPEFSQEFGQELGGEIVAKINGLETDTWAGILKQSLYSGLIGGITGGLVGSVQVMKENAGLTGEFRKQGFSDEEIDTILPVIAKAMADKYDVRKWNLRNQATAFADISSRKYIKGKEALTDEEKYGYIDPRVRRVLAAERLGEATLGEVPRTTPSPETTITPETDLAVKGRVAQVTQEMKELTKRKKQIEDEQFMREFDNKPESVALGKELAGIDDQLFERDAELLGLELGRTTYGIGLEGPEGSKTVKLKASVLDSARVRQAHVQLAKFKEGVRVGSKTVKGDIKAFQSYLVKMINASDALTPNQKKNMLNSLPAIQTEKSLTKKIDLLESRIAEFETANISKIYRAAIQTVLKKSIKRKFDAKTREVFDELVKLNKEVALDPAYYQSKYDPDDPVSVLRYDIAQAGSPFATLPDLKQVYFDLQTAFNKGVNALTEERRAMKVEAVETEKKLVGDISGNGKAIKFDINNPRQVEKLKGRKFTWATGDLTLYSRLKILASNSKAPYGQSFLEKFFNTFPARQAFETTYQQFGSQFKEITQKVFQLKDANDAADKWMNDTTEEKTITWENENEETGEVEKYNSTLTRAEFRKKWMEWQRPAGRRTLENKHHYTEETIGQIEKILTEQDMAFIKEQFRLYDEMYDLMAPLYRYLTNKTLPYEEFYSHLFTHSQDSPQSSVVDVMAAQGGLPGFFNKALIDDPMFKRATGASSGLRNVADIFAMEKYIQDVSYFMGYAELTSKIERFFGRGSKDIRENIDYYFGKSMLDGIDFELKRLTQGGYIQDFNPSYKWLTDFMQPTIRAFLSSPVIGTKQTTSMFAYLSEVSTVDFMKGLADLPRAVASGDINALVSSVFMYARGNTFEREMAFVKRIAEDAGKVYGIDRKTRFFDGFLGFMRMGDRAAMYAGGWAMYKYDTEIKGMSHEEALNHFVEFSTTTQQSTDVDQLPPALSSGNPLARLVSIFKQAPYQYLNVVRSTLINRKRITPLQMAKRLFVFHSLLPMIFQFVANGFKLKWEDEARAAVIGPYYDLVVIGYLTGNFSAMLWAMIADENWPEWRSNNDLVDSVAQSIKKTAEFMNQIYEDGGLEMAETLDLIKELATAVSPVAGTVSGAVRYGATAARGALRLMEGEYVDAMRNMVGFSNYVVDRANEE